MHISNKYNTSRSLHTQLYESTTSNVGEEHTESLSQKRKIDWQEQTRKVWNHKKTVIKVCGIGAAIGYVVALGIPKEYTASTLIAPEGYRRSTSSGISALAGMADIDIASSSTSERDAIFPSLYPSVVNSTPFLIKLFDVKVHDRKDSNQIPLSQYLKERQQRPWWSVITSAPSRMARLIMSLFRNTSDEDNEKKKGKNEIDPFRLTREEAAMTGAIASRINIGVDKKKRTITIYVTMQDPLVAATVADTVRASLKEYITNYRTAKARRNLEYAEKLRREAQAQYYQAQEMYTRYADTNRELVKLVSRADLIRLQNEMELASTVYNQTEKQVQAAKAKVEKEKPVYAVIQPVQVPLNPSKPRMMLIIAEYVLLSAAGSIVWVLFGKDLLKKRAYLATDKRK